MVERDPADRWGSTERLDDPRLKHEITSRLKGTVTRCDTPVNGRVISSVDASPLLAPGDSFVFEIERCHLTQDQPYDFIQLQAEEDNRPPFDIADELQFRGRLLFAPGTARPMTDLDGVRDSLWRWNCREAWADVPVGWITDVYDWDGSERRPRHTPVPCWRP